MAMHTCPHCGESYELPPGSAEGPRFMTGASGILVMGRGEAPVHRCESLTSEEAEILLQDAEWLEQNPPDPSG